MIKASTKSHLIPLSYSLVHKIRVGLSRNKPACPRLSQHTTIFIHHSASGDGHQRNAVALHALEDVRIHSLVVCLSWNHPGMYMNALLSLYIFGNRFVTYSMRHKNVRSINVYDNLEIARADTRYDLVWLTSLVVKMVCLSQTFDCAE